MSPIAYFEIPTPPDLFRWWPLTCIAAVALAWPAMAEAIDDAAEERRAEGTDWPRGVLGSASCMFDEFTLPHETFRYWAGFIWNQMGAQQ